MSENIVMKFWSGFIRDEQMMQALGADLAASFAELEGLICFQGDLGAGKSTIIRAFIKAYGYKGHVKSPTYTLLESYEVADRTFYHLDLYRLEDPQELEFIGIRDVFGDRSVVLVEWPEKGRGVLPEPVLTVEISHLTAGRAVKITAYTADAGTVVSKLTAVY